ncbi:unnamed protein product, partial [Urochloa humidicola]
PTGFAQDRVDASPERPTSRASAKLRACLNADAAPRSTPRRVVKARAAVFPQPRHHTSSPTPPAAAPVHPAPRCRRGGAPRARAPSVHTGTQPAAGRISSPRAGAGDEAVVERGARGGGRRRRQRQRQRGGAADVRPAVGGGAAGGGEDAGAGARRALHPPRAARLRLPPLALRLLPHPPRLRFSGNH